MRIRSGVLGGSHIYNPNRAALPHIAAGARQLWLQTSASDFPIPQTLKRAPLPKMSARVPFTAVVLLSLSILATGKLHGVVYEPFSQDESLCLGPSDVAAHLEQIAEIADHIRLKAIGLCGESTKQILKFAKKNDMTVMAGLSITGNAKGDKMEFAMLRQILKEYDESVISHVIVGDEMVFDLGLSAREGAEVINRAKALVKKSGRDIPVGTAEAWHILEFGSASNITSKVSDFLCMNMQPYWSGIAMNCTEGESCQDLGTLVDSKAEVLKLKFGKEVIICNTGWPTFGEKCCGQGRTGSLDGFQSAPSSENMETFLNNLVDATNLSLREYFIGDFFDADWKRFHAPCSDCQGLSKDFDCGARRPRDRECEVAYHFGLFTSDGKGKGFVIP